MIAALVLAALVQCPDGTPPPCRGAPVRAPASNSVAVLYFATTSRDSGDGDLAEGLTDEIILRLQQVRRLQVKSRFESQRVRARRSSAPAALGRDLGARYLVNGTIQRVGERLVVRVELTEASRGVGVWSERFDRTSASVLDVIDDVARGVATGVAGQLLPGEAADLSRRPSADPVAYEHFVRGNTYLARRAPASLARAIAEYEAAAAQDPLMKVAVARIAYAYVLGIAIGIGDLAPDSIKAKAGAAIARAQREAPDVPETWMAEGFRELMHAVFDREDRLDVAVAGLARGVQLGPRNAEAHHQYAQGLALQGADSAALAEYRAAIALEPGRAVSAEELSRHLILLDRFPEGRAWGDSAIAWDPQLVRGWLVRARARLATGDIPGADRDVAMAATLNPGARNSAEERAMRAMVLAAQGDTARARTVAESIAGPFTIFGGETFVAAGLPDRALDNIAQQSVGAMLCYRLRFPLLRALRGTPHYDRLAAGCPAPRSVR